ncbi:TBC1 domain family member 2A-like isoform X1 [Arapaima gigas]
MENKSSSLAESCPHPLQPNPPVLHEEAIPVESPGKACVNGLCPAMGALTGRAQMGGEQNPAKLCGYLEKLGGPLKSWKCRWFMYEEKQCQLFYYRTAQDVNPLGRIELAGATFGFPFHGEEGVFNIQTPERTFVLKAATHDAMVYWLQQLQLKRWQYRNLAEAPAEVCGVTDQGTMEACTHCTDIFLPIVNTPLGLVGEQTANLPLPRPHSTLVNVSFKHPLTELQNSMYNLRRCRSQDLNRSVFYLEQSAPPSSSEAPIPESQDKLVPAAPANDPDPAPEQEPPWSEPSLILQSQKSRSSVPMTGEVQQGGLDGMHSVLQQKTLRPAQGAMEENNVFIFLIQVDTQLRELEHQLTLKDARITQLEEHVRLVTEKNQAKQQVILRLSEQVAECLADPQHTITSTVGTRIFRQLQEEVEQLKDDIEAYRIQNKFLNSEIYQLTKLWRNSSEQGTSLMKKCALLEAKYCQMKGRYLGVLNQLQESTGLGVQQRKLVSRLIQDALQEDVTDTVKISPVR